MLGREWRIHTSVRSKCVLNFVCSFALREECSHRHDHPQHLGHTAPAQIAVNQFAGAAAHDGANSALPLHARPNTHDLAPRPDVDTLTHMRKASNSVQRLFAHSKGRARSGEMLQRLQQSDAKHAPMLTHAGWARDREPISTRSLGVADDRESSECRGLQARHVGVLTA